jgi:hypothetical protein
MFESAGPELFTTARFPLILSGLLVGVGSKVCFLACCEQSIPSTYFTALLWLQYRCRMAALQGI